MGISKRWYEETQGASSPDLLPKGKQISFTVKFEHNRSGGCSAIAWVEGECHVAIGDSWQDAEEKLVKYVREHLQRVRVKPADKVVTIVA